MDRKKILLLFGGESSEHDVSMASAHNVYAAIDTKKFDVTLCYIDRSGKWYQANAIDEQTEIEIFPVLGGGYFAVENSDEKIVPDVILPILHGKNGEDGSVQGLAQLLHIPIVGCDMTSSSICMDKVATKQIMIANNINIVPYKIHHEFEPIPSFVEIEQDLSATLFVKPARAGSSVGVSKVRNDEELRVALELAHKHDSTVLIEKAMTVREIEVAVLGTPPNHRASVTGEIKPGAEFYSYEDKYDAASKSTAVISADIDEKLSVEISALAEKIYKILDCSGLARIDFFLTLDGKVYLNEVNTLPGFTNASMYPKLWQHMGMDATTLVSSLIYDALASDTIDTNE